MTDLPPARPTIARRDLLRMAGGAGVLVAAAGIGRAAVQGLIWTGEDSALRPWKEWAEQRHRGPLVMVAAGVLAASPHNTQPWRFAVSRLGVDIFEDPARSLGAMDPFGRERLAGLGAAIHNMALASTGIGRSARVKLLPDPENPVHVARVLLGPEQSGPAPHALLPVIGRRHTHRGGWTGAPISAAVQQRLLDFARPPEIIVALFAAGSTRGQRFARLTDEATAAITEDPAMMAASHHWFRHERRDQQRLHDGLTMATSGVSPALAAVASLLPQPSAATEGRYWLEATRDVHLPTASLFGLIVARDPWDRRQALLAGSAWQRLHLNATALGLVAQPLNQLPEMIDRQRQRGQPASFARGADGLLDDPALRPTFAFRIGRAEAPAKPALRRSVSEVLGAPARVEWEVEQWRAAGGAF
jgi:nitroreductase